MSAAAKGAYARSVLWLLWDVWAPLFGFTPRFFFLKMLFGRGCLCVFSFLRHGLLALILAPVFA
jgi:hypothetical protein